MNSRHKSEFKTTSSKMQMMLRAGVLSYPSPKRSKKACEESFKGCTDAIVDISRNVQKHDKLNTASSAKELETPESKSSEASEASRTQSKGENYYSDEYSGYGDYSYRDNYSTYAYYSDKDQSASVQSYDENRYDSYSLSENEEEEKEEEEYESANENKNVKQRNIKAEDENSVRLSSYEETGKSNQNQKALDDAHSSSVPLHSLDENESGSISASNAKSRSSAKDRKVKLDSERGSSSKGSRVSKGQKSSEKVNTDSNKVYSFQKNYSQAELTDDNLSSITDDKNNNNSSSKKYNSTQKSDTSQFSSSKPARSKSRNEILSQDSNQSNDESADELTQKLSLLTQANQKLLAAVLENQKAIFNSVHDLNSEEALNHIQAAFDILSNNSH